MSINNVLYLPYTASG